MIYECDKCHAPLLPNVKACAKCGEQFDTEVPADAEVPRPGFSPAGTTSSFTPQTQPSPVYNTPSSTVAKKSSPSPLFSFLRGFLALPLALGLIVGAVVMTSPTKSSTGEGEAPSPLSNVLNPEHSVTYQVTGSAGSVDVTYENGTGGTEQKSHVAVPWSQTFQATSGSYLYLSAQNNNGQGNLTTEIDVDGAQRKQATASGAYVIANVSDLL